MQAMVLKSNGVLEIEERPRPTLAEDEYLVRVESAGVCNSDIFRAFAHGAYFYPLVMGHEVAGVIAGAGPRATRYAKGQRVVVYPLIPCRRCEACRQRRWAQCADYDYFGSRRDGGFQDYLAVKEWNLLAIPDEVPSHFACLCEPIAVSVHAAAMAPSPEPGAGALVLGAGLIGIITAKLLQKKGYEAAVADRNDFKLHLAEELGLGAITSREAEGLQCRFSLVVEATGAPAMFAHTLKLARPRGAVIWVGNIQGDLDLGQKEVSASLRKELVIKGVWNSDYQQGAGDDWAEALRVLAALPGISGLVTHRAPLKDLPRLLGEVYSHKSNPRPHSFLKIIVDLDARP